MKKVIRDGKVAVLYSSGYGTGWYSDHYNEKLLFDPILVEMVENNKQSEITTEFIEEKLGIKHVFCGGTSGLKIIWLPKNTLFRINEYDGAESIITLKEENYIKA